MPTIKPCSAPSTSPTCPGPPRLRRLHGQYNTRPSACWSTWWINCTASTATQDPARPPSRSPTRWSATGQETALKELGAAAAIPAKFEVAAAAPPTRSSLQAKEDKVDLRSWQPRPFRHQPSAGGQRGRIRGVRHAPARCWWCANNPCLMREGQHELAFCHLRPKP